MDREGRRVAGVSRGGLLPEADGPIDFCRCSHPLKVEGVAFPTKSGRVLLLANLTPVPQYAHLDLGDESQTVPCRMRLLDETTAEQAALRPLSRHADYTPGRNRTSPVA